MKIFRWKAIVPLLLFLALVVVLWRLFLNTAIRRAVEFAGTEIVGARVDLASARFRLRHADIVLRGLQVTDPDRPMTNLVEVSEMVADLNGLALLQKKGVIEVLAVRGVRFGTPRQSSGAIERQSPKTGAVSQRVRAWAGGLPRPSLDLTGIVGTAVNVPAIAPESLRTLRQAQLVRAQADSQRTAWLAEVNATNPQPTIDSARALSERLRGQNARTLGPQGVAAAASQVRTLTQEIQQSRDRLTQLQRNVEQGIATTRAGVAALDSTRRADYAFARGLVRIPSFAAPDVSAALFGDMARARLQPMFYWLNLYDEYAPAGLRPRADVAPRRARMDGTTYRFLRERSWPTFLVQHADADLAIGGEGTAAGAYAAQLEGFTTEPAVYGRPMTFSASRASTVGPRVLRLAGLSDRTGATPHDSLDGHIGGVHLPEVTLAAARGARLALGDAVVDVGFARSGGSINGYYRVHAPSATWARGDSAAAGPAPRLGSSEWASDLLWRVVSGVTDVQIEMRFRGLLSSPDVELITNVGTAVADAVRREIGAEIDRAEARVRAEVDRQIDAATAQARQRAAALESDVQRRVTEAQQQLGAARTDLEARLREVQSPLPVTLPGNLPRPRLPRP